MRLRVCLFFVFFFFNDTATTEIYTLSLHDALPIWFAEEGPGHGDRYRSTWAPPGVDGVRSLELAHADNPWSVDLHASLDREMFPGRPMTFGALPPTPGPRDGEVWQEFSRPVWVLREPLLLAYLAAHTSSHFYAITLVRLVELVLVARRDFGEADWRAFADLVRRT